MVKFGMSKGDPDVTTDSLKPDDAVTVMLRNGGFTPPEPGVDFTVTVPSPLERGKDYNYNRRRCCLFPAAGGNRAEGL